MSALDVIFEKLDAMLAQHDGYLELDDGIVRQTYRASLLLSLIDEQKIPVSRSWSTICSMSEDDLTALYQLLDWNWSTALHGFYAKKLRVFK